MKKGIRYKAKMLNFADDSVNNDGKVTMDAAKDIFQSAMDGNTITRTEAATLKYILQEYRFDPKAETFLKEKVAALPKMKEKSKKENDSERLYCICRKPDDGSASMIACDECDEWYHISCLYSEEESENVLDQDKWVCPKCTEDTDQDEKKEQPSKKKRNQK